MNRTDFDVDALGAATTTLTAEEAESVRALCARAAERLRGRPLDGEEAMLTAEIVGCRLPEGLLRTLSAFRRDGNDLGTLVLRNVPLDRDVPATPPGGEMLDWSAVGIATMAQLAIASRVGDVIAFADEKGGRLVQDVVPVEGEQQRQENSGTAFLELHTETGFHPFKPDFVTLLCLRPDHDLRAHTITGSIGRVLPRLSRMCVRTLREPLFRIRYSSSFTRSGQQGRSAPLPVLSGPEGDPDLVADFHAMEPLNREAQWALEELETVLLPGVAGVALGAGDLIVVDNRRAVHGRTAFTARYDGTDRWLRRCFAVADLRGSRGVRRRGSRVCSPLTTIKADLAVSAAGRSAGTTPAGER